MKREVRDKWLARLRDPNSKQARGAGAREHEDALPIIDSYICTGNEAMCCLVHGQFAELGIASTAGRGTYWLWAYNHKLPAERLAELNDYDRLSLSQIADWIEQNIPVED